MIIAGLGHVMCHPAKGNHPRDGRAPWDGSHPQHHNHPRDGKEGRDGRTRSNEDIRMDGFHYLLSLWSTQIVLSY
ncbi:hypothetical protein COCSADRAFT_333778 [Bipolaris sorokiniana ND90Pr]|uniref:Uncharacterized protein n=1 Tax=Cochliobolus sativus (strain ND90Pr / ATCC 201652) TaxID=665912 RepID=M2RSA9_COCSN|nr:uncharacterized protein COCSADRAFT_333778 [Bipolaris sorokiniana ND90Pr]EMD58113.1 hypothetical protein COCSADRAFT_333778 [Bipolaris sorokiniana ND90Pr]